jgi:hypothetical protein
VSRARSCLTVVCVAFGCVIGLYVTDAQADSCEKSRDYVLMNASDDLPRSPQAYQELYKSCLQTLQLPNVKDAFVLKSGAIAVLPQKDTVSATAGTLAQFCTQFPQQTLRFITRQEARLAHNVGRVVQLGTSQSTSCQKITGG